ncbi:eukaryotic aspartyl protease-domain-containing protein [Suillus subalutaceus]|uniref:eukaryotic aspartyl protease-domain-containing protein n=1 Tax=Suillus subalutaceus TaxID=48586 RepID=UPI001B85F873|nr:eukaryotic aspartyl protease-domain-containing protein [Suillus subalutaceus]KAG1843125.1 eukaryotic aspartyl protease-domain-containing protein [Suillus subalutaceus]
MRPSTALLTFCYLVPLVVVSPLDVYKSNSISIPLSRISRDTTIEDVKAHLTTVSHKYDITLRNYALNTGLPHSLSNRGPPYKLGERSTGSLTGDGNSVPLKNQCQFMVWLHRCWGASGIIHRPVPLFRAMRSLLRQASAYGNRTEMSGDEYTDVVELAGYRVINQTLGATDTYYSDFAASNAPDGLAGFAFQEISSYGAAPLFQTLVDSHILHQNVFGVSLSTQKDDMIFASEDRTRQCTNQTLTIVPVTVKGYWEIQLGGLSRNGEDMIVPTDKAQAIVDAGTAFIVTKPDNAVKYYENIKGARAVDEIPCDTIGLFAPTLAFGERLFPVSSSTFNLGPVHEGSSYCVAGLTGMPGMGGRFRKAEIVEGSTDCSWRTQV